MLHTLLYLYGPFAIHSYGLMIALGLLAFLYLIQRDPRFTKLALQDRFLGILMVGIGSALVGGKLLFLITNPHAYGSPLDLISFWQGGFHLLGSIVAIVLILPSYLFWIHVPVIPLLDLLAIYTPLLQSISRIGCFLSGCCYGTQTTMPWGIIYADRESAAPLYVCLHPAQLYSAIGLMLVFAAMYFVLQHRFVRTGLLLSSYLILVSLERFLVDFWRGDRELPGTSPFSVDQQIAGALFILGIIGFIISSYKAQRS